MKYLRPLALFFTIMFGWHGHAQSTNWGSAVCGNYLSITLSNTALTLGSNAALNVRIKNSATNVVVIPTSYVPLEDFSISLIDKSGKENLLKPEMTGPSFNNRSWREIGPGETYETSIKLPLGKMLTPGTYMLRVKKWLSIRRDGKLVKCDDNPLISNSIEVQLK